MASTSTLPVVANEMLNDPAILMTSKNPSLSTENTGGARRRHSAGVTFAKDGPASSPSDGGAKPKSGKSRNNRRRRRNTISVEEQENVQPSTSTNSPTNNGKRRRPRKFNKNNQVSPNQANTSQDTSPNKPATETKPRVQNQSPRGKSGSSVTPAGFTRLPFHNARNFDIGAINTMNRFARTNPAFTPYHPYNRNVYSPLVIKPGLSTEYVSRQIVDYHLRNRQTNDKYKSKQILRQSLENTLKQVFPNQFINLHLVGSTTNGIGDNVSSVDICILSRKREQTVLLPPNPPTSPINAANISQPATSTTTEPEKTTPEVESTEAAESAEVAAAPVPETQSDEEVVVIESTESIDSDTSSPKVEANKESPKVEEAKEAAEMEVDSVPVEAESAEADTKEVSLPKSPETPNQDAAETDTGNAEQANLTLETIQTILRGKNYASDIKIILAKVPIIKFKDNITGLNVTLNLNQDVSIRNSQLIRDYAKMDWRFPHLVMVMKQWARENRVNSAIDKTISSYGWTLMVIHYLQVCEPPVLPCLQKMIPRRYDQRINIEQSMNNWRKPINQWRSNNVSNLRQLLKSMFRYYGYSFNYDQHVISVRDGRVLDRTAVCLPRLGVEDNNPSQWNSFLCVEEPFNRNNATRSVHDKDTFDRIIDLLRTSSNALKGNRISLFNIIADDLEFPITY